MVKCAGKAGIPPDKNNDFTTGIESQPHPHRAGMYLFMMDLPVYGIAGCGEQALHQLSVPIRS